MKTLRIFNYYDTPDDEELAELEKEARKRRQEEDAIDRYEEERGW